jgi:hypothetical protein
MKSGGLGEFASNSGQEVLVPSVVAYIAELRRTGYSYAKGS